MKCVFYLAAKTYFCLGGRIAITRIATTTIKMKSSINILNPFKRSLRLLIVPILLLSSLSSTLFAQDNVYKSIDQSGVVTYSDEISDDTSKVETITVEKGPSADSQQLAIEKADEMVKRSDEMVQKRMDRNLELSKQRSELQLESTRRKAAEAEAEAVRAQNTGYYPTYSRPINYPPATILPMPKPIHPIAPPQPANGGISAN